MFFIAILLLTTLSIAGCAAYFSIYGLAAIFSGAFWAVVVMGSSLEAGKLVAASLVYRYRKKMSFMMKTYLISAIIGLMVVTSAGIFGFLSLAYQKDTLPLAEIETQIELYDDRKLELRELKMELVAQTAVLDAQVAKIPATHSTNQRKMRESQKPEREQIQQDLVRLSTELQTATNEQHKLKSDVLETRVHTGPIIFIANAFDRDVDDATKWMIFLIIFVFDPLAVVLTIGTNIVIMERMKKHENMGKAIEVYEGAMGLDEQVAAEEAAEHVTTTTEELEEHIKVLDENEKSHIASLEERLAKIEEPIAPVIINKGADIEEIREMLKQYEDKPLTPEEGQQKVALERTLRREEIVERTRRS